MSDKQESVILISETVRESWLRDMSTLAFALGLMLPGHFLGSEPIQWVGFAMLFMFVLFRASGLRQKSRYTIGEARARLDELEQGK